MYGQDRGVVGGGRCMAKIEVLVVVVGVWPRSRCWWWWWVYGQDRGVVGGGGCMAKIEVLSVRENIISYHIIYFYLREFSSSKIQCLS